MLLLRLIAASGFRRDSWILVSMLLINAAVLFFWHHHNGGMAWRIRLLFYPLAMNLLYPVLKTAIPAIHPKLEDGVLQAADRVLIGANLSVRLEPLVHPAITEFLSFCYMLYFVYLLLGQLWYLIGGLELLKKYYVGLFCLYAIGYFGYSVLPALGPYLAMAGQFHTPLTGGWFTAANSQLVLNGSNRVDVFPSLHCANSLYILIFDYSHKRWRFWLYLVPCIGFWISTIYLRYHYFVDLICGFLLGLLAWQIAQLGVTEESQT